MAHKYSSDICEKEHVGDVPQRVLEMLPLNQGHPVRHRCAACAYIEGQKDARGDAARMEAEIRSLREENATLRDSTALGLGDDTDDGEAEAVGNLIDSYPASEFKNLTRSTVAMLAYWRDPEIRLRELAIQLDASDLVDAIITPEFPTPSPGGKASFTDLMLESASTAVGIEAKRTERRYPLVRDWCSSDNRRRVLDHWCSLIRPRTGLDQSRVESLVYQMVHRTASVCARPAERAIVLYQLFGSDHADEYERDLRTLVAVLQPSSKLEVWLQLVPAKPTAEYTRVAKILSSLAAVERAEMVKRGIATGTLFDFSDAQARRITA